MGFLAKCFKTIYKIWEYKISKEQIDLIVAKEFDKLDKDKSQYLDIKDLCLAIYEYYKSKK